MTKRLPAPLEKLLQSEISLYFTAVKDNNVLLGRRGTKHLIAPEQGELSCDYKQSIGVPRPVRQIRGIGTPVVHVTIRNNEEYIIYSSSEGLDFHAVRIPVEDYINR